MLFSKQVMAIDNNDSAEVVFKEIWKIINEKRTITPEIVDYSVEIIKKWPESFYAFESIKHYHHLLAYVKLSSYTKIYYSKNDDHFRLLEKNSRWFEKHIVGNDTAEIETAEVIIYAAMLYEPDCFTDYNCSMSYFPTVMHNKDEIYEIAPKFKRYESNYVKEESIRVLKYIENYSKNNNYKVLAFIALLEHYCSTEEGIKHVKQFTEKYPKHPAIAEIRLYLSDVLLAKNKFDEAIDEIQKVIKTHNNVFMPLKNFKYDVVCYSRLVSLYFDNKDYINAQKYILLLKQNAPPDLSSLKEMEEKLNIIEKFIKK